MGDEPLSVTIRQAALDDMSAIAEAHVRSWQWAYRGQLSDNFLDGLSNTLAQRIESGAPMARARPRSGLGWRCTRYGII